MSAAVQVSVGAAGALDGDLAVPDAARGLVVFAHGSGSSRHSPRNHAVAAALRQAGLATLLIDLLLSSPAHLRRDPAEQVEVEATGEALAQVRCPVLLLVGGRDETVLDLNEQARAQLTAPTQLVVVPGATHLFEEPGALEQVAQEAAGFFCEQLA